MKRKKIILGLFIIISCLYFNCGAFFYTVRAWPNGKIPYTYSQSFKIDEVMFIEFCMQEWEKETNIDFVYDYSGTKDTYVLQIKRNKNEQELSSSSSVGYCPDPEITFGVLSQSVVIHELGHVLGLLHEHQRPDRNKYITVNYTNIDADVYFCFERRSPEEFLYNYTKFPYDYYSVMHYYEYSFSNNGKPAITAPVPIGNTNPSPIDILKIIEIYGQPKNKK